MAALVTDSLAPANVTICGACARAIVPREGERPEANGRLYCAPCKADLYTITFTPPRRTA